MTHLRVRHLTQIAAEGDFFTRRSLQRSGNYTGIFAQKSTLPFATLAGLFVLLPLTRVSYTHAASAIGTRTECFMRGMEVGQGNGTGGFEWLGAAAHLLSHTSMPSVFETCPPSAGVLFQRDMGTNRTVWNHCFSDLTGYASNEQVHTTSWWKAQIHSEDRSQAEEHFQQALRSQASSYCLHYRFRHRQGHWLFLRESGAIDWHPGGWAERITGFVCDLTPLRDAQEQLAQAHMLLERITAATPDLLYLYDLTSQRNLYANHEMGRILGYSSSEITAMGSALLPRILHPDDLATFAPFRVRLEGLDDGEVFEHEYRVRDASGGYRWLRAREVVFARTPDGKPSHIVGLAQDVTEHKEREARLQQSEAALRETDHRKDEFLAMLSHELRNPLAPITTALQIMAIRSPGDTARQRTVIERQVRYLERLIGDLLDVSRVTQGKVELRKEVVELAKVLRRSIELSLPLFRHKRQRVQVEIPPHGLPITADPVRLSQVFTNVLTNASKYTKPHGHVYVTACVEGVEAVVAIRDSGDGMSPELVSKVFDLFVQGPRTIARSEGGLGLGLAIARRLVEMHDGTISARSDGPGKGSEFVIRLPLSPKRRQKGRSKGVANPDQGLLGLDVVKSHRVLVVDDNRDAAETLAEALDMFGHQVEVAFDGSDVCRYVQEFAPEIVFMDIGLPGLDGYEVARRLREDGCVPRSLRLVAVTGYGHDEDRKKAMAAGFDEHLVKPVDLDRIQQILRDLG